MGIRRSIISRLLRSRRKRSSILSRSISTNISIWKKLPKLRLWSTRQGTRSCEGMIYHLFFICKVIKWYKSVVESVECALFGHEVVQVAQLWLRFVIVLQLLAGAGFGVLHLPAGFLVALSLVYKFLFDDGIDIFFVFICVSQFGFFSFFLG